MSECDSDEKCMSNELDDLMCFTLIYFSYKIKKVDLGLVKILKNFNRLTLTFNLVK